MGTENLAPTGMRFPKRLARSDSIYRLSYPGPMDNVCPFQTVSNSSLTTHARIRNLIFLYTDKEVK